jgi:hypothetical protein
VSAPEPGGHGRGVELWSSAAWRAAAVAWLDARLAEAGMERTGEVEQPTLRPWGTVLAAPTDRGPVWLKAPGAAAAFELPLYELLGRVGGDTVLAPIAVDAERGWMLLPDGGATLGERLEETDLVEAMVTILPRYGRLQRALLPHADRLLSLGLADMRAAVMPRRFDEALEAVGRHSDADGRATLARVAAMRETFVGWCERLAGAAVGPSIDHNDLHPWNVFVGSDPAGPAPQRARFYDWGDSVVAHPFSSMLLGLGMIHLRLGVGADDPAVVRPRDAYLEVFGDLAGHAELVEELELACQVGKVARALSWERALRMQGWEQAGEFADAPLQALGSLLSGTWIAAV